jgi:hypothetical protein
VGCDDYERQRRVGSLDPIEQLQPAHAIHADIAEDDVEGLAVDDLQGRDCVGRELASVTVGREHRLERFAHLGVVVHDQNPRPHRKTP